MKAVIRVFNRDDEILALPSDMPELQWAIVWTRAEMAREIVDASILIASNRGCTPEMGPPLRQNCTHLKWIHLLTVGYDKAVAMGLPEGPLLTNATGIKAAVVAEQAMALLLSQTRQLNTFGTLQREQRWLRDEMSP